MDLKKYLTLCEKADTARRASAPPACQWDAEGRMTSVDSGSTATQKYNALGQRVERFLTNGSWTFDYLFGVGGEELGLYSAGTAAWFDQNVPMGGRLLVLYGSPLRVLHANRLGTTTVVTDQTGAELEDQIAYPWGQSWTTAGLGYDRHFAGMHQPESPEALIPTDFRKYNPALGRWMSPDPLAGDVTNPQSLNRYAYVLNNPVSNIDPTGLFWQAAPDDVTSVDLTSLGNAGVLPPQASGDGEGTASKSTGSGFTLGVRKADQTWKQCMSANSRNYSANFLLPNPAQNGVTGFLLGNDVSTLIFGDKSEGVGGLAFWEGGSRSFKGGVGKGMTAFRRSASIFDLNLIGKTGPAPMILAKTGVGKFAALLSGAAEAKLGLDIILTGGEAIGCFISE